MATIKISGIAGLDGEYPFEGGTFTNRELHTIKEIAGVRAGELEEAFKAGDNDLVVAIAVICLTRAGKEFQEGMLWDATAGAITAEGEEEEENPPAQAPAERSEKPDFSGPSSEDDGESPASDRNIIGFPDSATGSG